MKPQALLLLFCGLAISSLSLVNPDHAQAKTVATDMTISEYQDCNIKPSLDDDTEPTAGCDRTDQNRTDLKGKDTDILDDIEEVNKKVGKVTNTIRSTTDTINSGKKSIGDLLKVFGIGILN
jgi:peptidoglycan hydrolase CwlO-like protein